MEEREESFALAALLACQDSLDMLVAT